MLDNIKILTDPSSVGGVIVDTDALALAGAVYPASQAMVNVRSSAQYTSQLQPMIMMMHQPKAGNRIYM